MLIAPSEAAVADACARMFSSRAVTSSTLWHESHAATGAGTDPAASDDDLAPTGECDSAAAGSAFTERQLSASASAYEYAAVYRWRGVIASANSVIVCSGAAHG